MEADILEVSCACDKWKAVRKFQFNQKFKIINLKYRDYLFVTKKVSFNFIYFSKTISYLENIYKYIYFLIYLVKTLKYHNTLSKKINSLRFLSHRFSKLTVYLILGIIT